MNSKNETERTHRAADVETVIVDPEDVLEVMRRNYRDEHQQHTHVLRVSPPLEGKKEATPHVSEDGAYYPPEMPEKPLHLGPQHFVVGEEHPQDMPKELAHPDRETEKQIFDEHDDADDFEEWWNTAVGRWESRVRQHFEDKQARLVADNMQGPETTVEVLFRSEGGSA